MVRATEPQPVAPFATLDYAPPPPAKPARRDTIWGVFISLFLANGVGWVAFGFFMMMGYRDDYAGPVAFGMASIALAAGLAGTWHVSRRLQQNAR